MKMSQRCCLSSCNLQYAIAYPQRLSRVAHDIPVGLFSLQRRPSPRGSGLSQGAPHAAPAAARLQVANLMEAGAADVVQGWAVVRHVADWPLALVKHLRQQRLDGLPAP